MRRVPWPWAVGLLLALALPLFAGCGTGAKACGVVDIAANACTVVRYLAPDGSVEELTPEDLEQAAARRRAARGASPSTGGGGAR